MEEFIQNFNAFKEFLNAPSTQYAHKSLLGERGEQALVVIKEKFDELGLNNAF